ncbi:MAG: MFS transporter [Alphaproteobacteria bacterium]|nr:MFS transporter [Alphaproteobacteria bacterium]
MSKRMPSLSSAGRFENFRRVLGHPEFRHYLTASTPNLIAFWMHRIAVGWVMWELTGSAAWLGILAFAELFPTVLLTAIGGVLVDRLGAKKMAMITQGVLVVLKTVMALIVGFELATPMLLVGLTVIQGLTMAFFSPARLAMVPQLVPTADVGNAVALNSILFNLARFIGPALAGFTIAMVGPAFAMAAYAVTAAYFILALQLLVNVPAPPKQEKGSLDIVGDLVAGLRYVRRHEGIAPLLVLTLATSFALRAVWELLPTFADGIWNAGAEGLGILAAAPAVGSILAALYLGARNGDEGLVKIAILAVPASSLVLIGFAYAPSFWLGCLMMAVAGATLLFNGVVSQSLMQTSSDKSMRGRIMGLYWMIFRGAPAIGALVIGGLGDVFGMSGPFSLACIGAALVAALVWRRRETMAQRLERSV